MAISRKDNGKDGLSPKEREEQLRREMEAQEHERLLTEEKRLRVQERRRARREDAAEEIKEDQMEAARDAARVMAVRDQAQNAVDEANEALARMSDPELNENLSTYEVRENGVRRRGQDSLNDEELTKIHEMRENARTATAAASKANAPVTLNNGLSPVLNDAARSGARISGNAYNPTATALLGKAAATGGGIAATGMVIAGLSREDQLTADAFAAHFRRTGRDETIIYDIAKASVGTGYDLNKLLITINNESGFNRFAKAQGSSATGLSQFLDQTWLAYMKQHGAGAGHAQQAAAIRFDADKKKYVVDGGDSKRQEILNLRYDTYTAAYMTARYNQNTERTTGSTDMAAVYKGYVFGQEGAARLAKADKRESAADIMGEKVVAANPGLFFKRDGSARTIAEMDALFERKADRGENLIARLNERYNRDGPVTVAEVRQPRVGIPILALNTGPQ